MNELNKKNLLHTDLITATGKTVAENIEGCVNKNPEVIRPIDDPYSQTGGIAVLKGNLAPDSGVVKRSAVAPEMLKMEGPARVFDCEEDAIKAIKGCLLYTSIGVVKNVVKNINGAFVEFDQDEIGFLSMRHRQYKAGDEVLVQIKKEATEEKRPMLSDQIELTGEYLVLTSDKLSVGISNKIHQKEKKQELKEMAEPLVTVSYTHLIA